MNIIELKNVSKLYKQVIGLNNISLTIRSGVTGFLGPNGAGKSTLMKILTGQLKLSKGTATIWGERIWNRCREANWPSWKSKARRCEPRCNSGRG